MAAGSAAKASAPSLNAIMFTGLRDRRLAEAHDAGQAVPAQLTDTQNQIHALLNQVIEATSPILVHSYETRLERLERQMRRLSEQAETIVPSAGRFEQVIEHALAFLARP